VEYRIIRMKNNKIKPPILASWIIEKLSLQYHKQMALGDIDELYLEILENSGKKMAGRWYWRQTMKSVPFLVHNILYGSTTMFKNYMKITLRNIIRNKLSCNS